MNPVQGKAYIAADHQVTDEGLKGEVRRVIAVDYSCVMYQTAKCAVPFTTTVAEFIAWAGPEVVQFLGRWAAAT